MNRTNSPCGLAHARHPAEALTDCQDVPEVLGHLLERVRAGGDHPEPEDLAWLAAIGQSMQALARELECRRQCMVHRDGAQ